MGKYSLVEFHMIIPYNTIEGKYVVMGYFSCLLLILFLFISKTTKKRVNTDFRIIKPVKTTADTKRE